MQSTDHDLGLELAVRRRRTKSLQDEGQLRRKLVAKFNYGGIPPTPSDTAPFRSLPSLQPLVSKHRSLENFDSIQQSATNPLLDHLSDVGSYEEWGGNESIPRDTDRILEQFVMMMLRIGAFLKTGETDASIHFNTQSLVTATSPPIDITHLSGEDTETPPQVANSKIRTTSYLQDYPQIFMKKATETRQLTEQKLGTLQSIQSNDVNEDSSTIMIQKLVAVPTENDTEDGKASILKSNILKESESLEEIKLKLKAENFTHKNTESENHIENITEPDMTRVKDDQTELAQFSEKGKVTQSLGDFIKDLPRTTNESDDHADINLAPKDSLQSIILKYKENDRKVDFKTESKDSLQFVIDRMKKSLSAYRNSMEEASNKEINEDDTETATSSKTNRARAKKYNNSSSNANAKEQSPNKKHTKND